MGIKTAQHLIAIFQPSRPAHHLLRAFVQSGTLKLEICLPNDIFPPPKLHLEVSEE